MPHSSIYTRDYGHEGIREQQKKVPAKIFSLSDRGYPILRDKVITRKRSSSGEKLVLAERERMMHTVYDMSYGKKVIVDVLKPIKIIELLKPIKVEDEFMLGLEHTYSTILPIPMAVPSTMHRIFGYPEEQYLYEPLTTYQDEIGRPGFEWLSTVRGSTTY